MKYRITCDVAVARGFQNYIVEAADKNEALALHNAGKSHFEDEEVEVTELGKPEISEAE